MKINESKILEVRNLNVKYAPNQKFTIKNANLDLYKGDHLAIIGPSGCGKTTFVKTIVHMLPEGSITEGHIKIFGQDITKIDKKEIQLFRRNNFGFIYQDSIKKLNPLMTVGDHLYELFKTHFQDKPSLIIKEFVEETFRRVGIQYERLDSFPHQFSGGMRQRVSLAMALALKPKILIADEPTTSLDTKTSFEVMNEIKYLSERSGTTLVLISHDINLAAKWCKKVLIMDQGLIKEQGNIKAVLKSPKSEICTKLVKASNISFGLPNRHGINTAFIPMAISAGMTSAIMNPVSAQEMNAVRAANLLMNNDTNGSKWILNNRPVDNKGTSPRNRRFRGRRLTNNIS